MKKTFLFGIALAGIFLTSCLGDNESTYTGSNEFAVVKTENGTKYAAVSGGYGGWYIVSNEIDKYEAGDALFLGSYKVNTKNFINAELVRADYVNVSETFTRNNQKQMLTEVVDTTANVKAGIGVKNLSRVASDPNVFFGNRILFDYNVDQKEGEVYDIKFVYDKEKQVDDKGVKLPANTYVLDVVVSKGGQGVGDAQAKSKRVVADMTGARDKFGIELGNVSEKTVVSVGLRYSRYNVSKTKYELYYVPQVFEIWYLSEKN